MRKNLSLIFALIILALLPSVLADLQITAQDTFNVAHNSVLSIPFTLGNTGTLVTGLDINITSLTNPSNIINVPIDNPSKQYINATSTTTYSIDNYPIAQYVAPGNYPVTISVGGNESGTGVSATKSITITVNQTKSIALSTNSISVESAPGTTQRTTFIITNNGNVNLTNIIFSQSNSMQDNDNDTVTLSLTSSSSLSLLQPGQTATITVEATIPSNEDYGAYNTNIGVNSSEGVTATVAYSINVLQTLCDKGRKGDYFDVEITNPDSGDDFYPNDIIPVEVKVRNSDDNERDVVIVANLFDTTDNQFLDAEVETDGSVGDNTYEYFSVDLTVPVDIKSHNFRLYAKAYEDGEEETQCNEDYISIDIKRDTHAVIVDKVELPDTVNCGENFDVKLTLANIGKKDEDVKVNIYNSELGINEEKTLSIDREDKKSIVISGTIPKDAAEGNHSLKMQTFFHLSNDIYEDSITRTDAINIGGNCVSEASNLALTTEVVESPYTNQQFPVKLNFFNTGDKTNTYIITASGYEGWARLDKIEPSIITLGPSETASSYLYLTTQNISGSNSFKVKVAYGDKKIEKVINVEVKEKVTAPKAYQGFVTRLSNLTGFDLITVNVILGIAIVLVLMWIIRVRRAY